MAGRLLRRQGKSGLLVRLLLYNLEHGAPPFSRVSHPGNSKWESLLFAQRSLEGVFCLFCASWSRTEFWCCETCYREGAGRCNDPRSNESSGGPIRHWPNRHGWAERSSCPYFTPRKTPLIDPPDA